MINLKKKVVLPVWFHTETSAQKEELGMEKELSKEDYEIRNVIFYKIDSLEPFSDHILGECTVINCGGKEFTTNIRFENIEEFIQDRLDGIGEV